MVEQTTTKDSTDIVHPEHIPPTAEQILAAIATIDTIIRSYASEALALKNAINKVFHLFQCDRVWLYFPCNPGAESFKVVYETTHPDFTGVNALDKNIPMSSDVAGNCRRALATPFTPVIFHPIEDKTDTHTLASGFQVQSMMCMALQPRIGDAWMFGLHQCDHARAWHPDEQRLFQLIGYRIVDLLDHNGYADRIHESEQRYHKVLEMAPDPIFVHQDGKVLYANPAIFRLLGLEKKADLIGQSIIPFVDPSLRKTVRERMEQSKRTGQKLPVIELKLHRRDGKIRYVESTAMPIVYNGETAHHVFSRDITELKHTVEELKANSEQFQLFTENSIEEIWQLDTDGNLIYVSPAVEKIFGYTVEEALNLHFLSFFPEKSNSQAADLFSRALSGETLQVVKLSGLKKDGREIIVEASVMPVRKENKIIGVQGIARDISERMKAEAALRNSEERCRLLAENMFDVLFLTDDKMRLIYYSPSVHRLLGYTPEEMLTLPFETYIAPQFLGPGLKQVKNRLAREHEGRGDNESRTWTLQYIHKDGRHIWGELITTPMRSEDGSFSGLIGTIRDIDQRKRTQEALQESEERLRTILESVQTGIVIIEPQTHRIVEVNSTAVGMIGADRLNIVGRICHDFIHPAQPGERPITDQGDPHEQVLLRANGDRIPILKSVSTIIMDGKPHLLANVVDITERKQLEARLRHAQKMESIGNLAGGIAHDFNNILFPIVGLAELLLDDLPNGSEAQMQVRQILKAGLRASDLVNQILAFSRQSETKMIPLRPNQILSDVISLCRATIPADIPIVDEFQNDCGVIMADPTQLHQIAMNLITNAYHAVEAVKGRITVKLEKVTITQKKVPMKNIAPGPWVRLSVIDTGCGMEPEVLERIFEPYFTTKARGKGTGLGLAVVYGLVKDHGGEIKPTSTVNRGTTMDVYFPAHESHADEIPHKEKEQHLTGSEIILLVDDEAPIVQLERMILERYGYRVHTRTSSTDALEAFKSDPDRFDLVITDMTMPEMTGEQLARALLRIKPDIAIIICTGFSERIDSQMAKESGIKGYLMKPVVKSEMLQMVRTVLDDAG